MSILNIKELENIQGNLLTSDFYHTLKEKDSLLLSYKAKTNLWNSYFETASTLTKLESKLDSINTAAANLFAKFAAKSYVDSTYASKELISNTTPSFLLYDSMEAILANYVTNDNLDDRAAQIKYETSKLADEMTDFVGAAVVGINQSQAASTPLSVDKEKE